ncbi:MAG TPA: LysR family transcriptional regulator [Hyphomicrobiaceae bacterium]|jgi:DNA-binding transcriptional LysR family regulator|nr:LysR family transcriptional regulator [Hyphomicrobiaceae bacterium]
MLDKLELLLLLAKERHFGRAAEAAGVSQPTFSSAVKSLERSLGTALVERGSRFRGFTTEGERVLEWARRLVGDARAMRQELQSLKGRISGHLRIGAIPATLPYLPSVTVPFHERFPDVRLSVLSATSTDILARMENLELDVGISYIDNEPIGRVSVVPLYREQYMLLVSSGSRLARLESITWSDASKLPLCLLTPETQTRRIVDRILRENGLAHAPTLESNSMVTLFSHVRTGHWVGIIPSRLAGAWEAPRQLKAIPLEAPGILNTIGLLIRGRPPHPPHVSAFVDVVQRVLRADRKLAPASAHRAAAASHD